MPHPQRLADCMNIRRLTTRALHHRIFAALLIISGMAAAAAPCRADFPAGPSPAASPSPRAALPPPIWKLGSPAPELHVATLAAKHVKLSDYRGKLVVLEFGSITEPAFRLSAAGINWLARKWAGKAQFIVVYQQESHPAGTPRALQLNAAAGFAVPQPQNIHQRRADALLAVRKLSLKFPLVTIDNWRNQTSLAYGSLANMTFLIDANGRLAAAWPWMTPWQINSAITATLAGKPVPAAAAGPEFGDPAAPPLTFDYMGLPPGAPATFAAALDHAHVTRSQLADILPAVMRFSTALLKARQQLLRLRQTRAQPDAAARSAVRTGLKQLRKAALELTTALQRRLTNQQYELILSAINRGRLRRIFTSDDSGR